MSLPQSSSPLALFPSPVSFSGCLISFFPIRSGWFCVIASYIYMYHGFSVSFFDGGDWFFFVVVVSILFWGFFAILNHMALKAVTGLTLKEGTGRISFRPGHQLTYPTALIMRSKQLITRIPFGKTKQLTVIFTDLKSLANGHHGLKNLFAFVKEEACSIRHCTGEVWWDPSLSLLGAAQLHGCVSPSRFVQSVSNPPLPLPLLYLYCQETSFHLGLLCFVRWVLHYMMCLFLCVLWGCLEHN